MLYNKKQNDLLKESIIKWEQIVDGTRVDRGIEDCALCLEYYEVCKDFDNPEIYGCEGCPIKQFTGKSECRGTPYSKKVVPELELKFLEMLLKRTILLRDLT